MAGKQPTRPAQGSTRPRPAPATGPGSTTTTVISMDTDHYPIGDAAGEIVVNEEYLSDPRGYAEKLLGREKLVLLDKCRELYEELVEKGIIELDDTAVYIGGVLRTRSGEKPYIGIRKGRRTTWIPLEYLCVAASFIEKGYAETIKRLPEIIDEKHLEEAKRLLEWLHTKHG